MCVTILNFKYDVFSKLLWVRVFNYIVRQGSLGFVSLRSFLWFWEILIEYQNFFHILLFLNSFLVISLSSGSLTIFLLYFLLFFNCVHFTFFRFLYVVIFYLKIFFYGHCTVISLCSDPSSKDVSTYTCFTENRNNKITDLLIIFLYSFPWR